MKEVRLKLPQPHSKQKPILDSKAKIKVLKCGRQSGKSTVALILAVQAMLAKKSVAYVCHEFDLSKKFYQLLLDTIPEALIVKSNSTSLSIQLWGGGKIQFYSGNATKTLRGNTIHLILCDEFAYWRDPQTSFESDIGAVLARYNGDCIILSTPYGKNYFTEIYDRAEQCTDGYMQAFYFTCFDNPYLSLEYLLRKESELPKAVWQQEYLALEGANQNCIVDLDTIERNTIKILSDKPALIFGIDVAKTHDFTSITGLDCEGVMCYHHHFQKNHIPTMGIIKQLPENVTKVMDSTGTGDVLFEQLQLEVPNLIGFKYNRASKPNLIKELILSLERDELKFNEVTAKELTNFQYKNDASGYISYNGKPFDDCVNSLALANKYRKYAAVQNFEDRFFIG
jgi:hypothetical protein